MHYCSVGMWEVGIWISVPSHLHQQMSGSASHWKYSPSYCCHAGVCNDSEKQWKLLWNNINLGWPLFWVSLMTTRSDKVHSNTSETKCLLVLVVYSLYCTYIQINERHVLWSIFLARVLHYGALKMFNYFLRKELNARSRNGINNSTESKKQRRNQSRWCGLVCEEFVPTRRRGDFGGARGALVVDEKSNCICHRGQRDRFTPHSLPHPHSFLLLLVFLF